jgi:hypothetical protein
VKNGEEPRRPELGFWPKRANKEEKRGNRARDSQGGGIELLIAGGGGGVHLGATMSRRWHRAARTSTASCLLVWRKTMTGWRWVGPLLDFGKEGKKGEMG